nr:thymidine kinase UL23 [Psittacid alphaherpesvirus 6]
MPSFPYPSWRSRSPSRGKRLLRVYVEGPFGIGKTSTLKALLPCNVLADPSAPFVVTPEPMRYWRDFFADLIFAVGAAGRASLVEKGEAICARGSEETGQVNLVSETFASIQMRFADPYLLLHDRLHDRFGTANVYPGLPDAALFFDRHSLSSTACFPGARFLNGNCEVDAFLSILIKTPHEPPGCNMVVLDLADIEEHVARITRRGRVGETVDVGLLTALRTVYAMLVNSIDYANSRKHSDGPFAISERDWLSVPLLTEERRRSLAVGNGFVGGQKLFERLRSPHPGNTFLALLKAPETCETNGSIRRIHAWAADAFFEKLRGMYVIVLSIDGKSPDACGAEMASTTDSMTTTTCGEEDLAFALNTLTEYRQEVAG